MPTQLTISALADRVAQAWVDAQVFKATIEAAAEAKQLTRDLWNEYLDWLRSAVKLKWQLVRELIANPDQLDEVAAAAGKSPQDYQKELWDLEFPAAFPTIEERQEQGLADFGNPLVLALVPLIIKVAGAVVAAWLVASAVAEALAVEHAAKTDRFKALIATLPPEVQAQIARDEAGDALGPQTSLGKTLETIAKAALGIGAAGLAGYLIITSTRRRDASVEQEN